MHYLSISVIILIVLCNTNPAIAQGYGNIKEDQVQPQPSRSGNQNQYFDSSNAPSYDNAEPTNPQYQEQRCAAEYPAQDPGNTDNPQPQQQQQPAGPPPTGLKQSRAGRPNPGNGFQAQEPRRPPITTPPSSPEPEPATEETNPTDDTQNPNPDPDSMESNPAPAPEPRIDPRVQPNPAPKAQGIPRPQAAMLDNDVAPSGGNQRKSEPPSSMSTEALIKLITELNNKLQNLEESQRTLNKNVDDLQARLKAIPVKKKEATQDLVSGQPAQALEKWKELDQNIDSVEQLQNETSEIVQDALEQKAPPPAVMDFVHEIPNKPVQATAYNAVADKMIESDEIQESMNWKEMTPYCRNAAQDTGRNSPTTMKMLNLQDQMRLKANQPISQGSMLIQEQRYIPAASVWLNMVQDIPENPAQLETNMKSMMIRTYAKDPFNLPMAFRFILILPESQGNYKRVAYNCLLEEMQANGHVYDPSNSRKGQAYQVPQPGNDQQRPAQPLQTRPEQPSRQQRNQQQSQQQPQQNKEGFGYY